MKKLIAIALLSIASTGSFAANTPNGLAQMALAPSAAQVNWSVDTASDVATMTNNTSTSQAIVVFEEKISASMNRDVNDVTNVTCGQNKPFALKAGSSVICNLAGNETVTVQIPGGSFKVGAAGQFFLI